MSEKKAMTDAEFAKMLKGLIDDGKIEAVYDEEVGDFRLYAT